MSRYYHELKGTRVDATLGPRYQSHYANHEPIQFLGNPSVFGRNDVYQHLSLFGINALAQSQYASQYLPGAYLTYGERPDGALPYPNDGSTATTSGGRPYHPHRQNYDLNIPMSRTLPIVDGLSGEVQNNYNDGDVGYDTPEYDQQMGVPAYGQFYGRNVYTQQARDTTYFPNEMEPILPAPIQSGQGSTDMMNIRGTNYNFTGVDQEKPVSVVSTNQGGPGVHAPIGAVSRKNALFNAQKNDRLYKFSQVYGP